MTDIKDKDLNRGRWFSFMLPGLGQIYLGAYLRGMGLFLGFTLLAMLPEARLFLPLAALLAAAEIGRFKGKRVWVGSGIWEQMPSWSKQLQKVFEKNEKPSKSRPVWYTAVGVMGFCGWMMLFAPALYPFEAQSQVNDDVERISDQVRNFRAKQGRLPAEMGELSQVANTRPVPMKDPWGSVYAIENDESGFKVRSAGHDRKFDTPDDFVYRFR